MASLLPYLVANALLNDGDVSKKKEMIEKIIKNIDRATDNDRRVFLNIFLSWIQTDNSNYTWLKNYGYSLLKLYVQSYPSLIREMISPSATEIILATSMESFNSDNLSLRTTISTLPDSNPKNGVDTTLAKHLMKLLEEKYEDSRIETLYGLLKKVRHFAREQDQEIAKFLVNKLAEIKIVNPQETKKKVDKVVNLIDHWLICEDNYAEERHAVLMNELYQKIVKSGITSPGIFYWIFIIFHFRKSNEEETPNATVASLLTKVSNTKLIEGLQNLPLHLVAHTSSVLADWVVHWPYAASAVIPMLMYCLKILAEERKCMELTALATKFVPQILKKLCVPVFQNTAGIFFFLMIASHASPEPLKQLIPELPHAVKQMQVVGAKTPVVSQCLRKLAGLCTRLAEEHQDLVSAVQDIFKEVQIPTEEELSQTFMSEDWFPAVAKVADLTTEASIPLPVNTGPRGLCNLGNTCYMNAIMQALFFTPRFRRAVLKSNPTMQREPLLWQMQRLFCLMSFSPRRCISPNAELNAVAKPPGFTMGHQEDCSEFLVYLLNTLHEQEQGKTTLTNQKPSSCSTTPKPEPSTSSSPNQPLKRWTTEEDLSDADPAVLLNGRRKARSLATFDETSPPSSVCPPPTPVPNPLTDAYSDSKDSGIHSVGSTDDDEEDTLVQGIFGGRQSTSYRCLQCDFEYKTVDKFLDLQLALPAQESGLSIPDLISYFLQPEQLTGENKYHCRRCNLLQDATKTISIEKAPEHLILTIKRFCYEASTNQTVKIMVPVRCPDTIVLSSQHYELYAIVLHAGSSPHSGHYHSQAKSLSDSWLWLNDEVVSDIQTQEWAGADTPYVLFYRQTGTCSPNDEVSLSSLLPRLQRLIEDDARAYKQENRLSVSDNKRHHHPPPPPPPSGGSGCGENMNTTSNRYIC